MARTEYNLEHPSDILALKATGAPQKYRYQNITALQVVVSPKGLVGFRMRFRGPGGELGGGFKLGSLDRTKRKHVETPVVGQALTPQEAVILANLINTRRKNGADIVAERRTQKFFPGRGETFAAQVLEFTKHDRKRSRRWKETAAALGLRYPWQGDDSIPEVIVDGLCDRWRDRPVAEITKDELSAVIKEAQKTTIPGWGTKIKDEEPRPSRGRRLASALGSFYKWMKDDERIEDNVFRNVSRPKAAKARERALNTEIGIRNADELRWLWAATLKAGYPYGPLLQILLLTGCRRSEISQMEWSELSDDLSMLHLPGARTKNKKPHDVPLSRQAQDILRSIPRINDTYVFVNKRSIYSPRTEVTQTYMGNFSLLKSQFDVLMLEEAVKDCNKAVTIEPWDVHDLRRTASTGMNSIGIFPHIVEAVINHISGSRGGVAGTYNRAAYAKEKRDAVDRWGAYIESIVSGRKARNVIPMRGHSR